LVILDKWLAKNLLPSPSSMSGFLKSPHGRHVDLDRFIHNVQLVEPIDDLQSLVNSLDVESEVVGVEDCSRLEPFHNTSLACAIAAGVCSLGNPAKGT
jgi:hypothetical protein